MTQERTTNSRILQEYYTQHRSDLSRLDPRIKTKWELATKLVDESYAFPVSSCPWENYFNSNAEFLNTEGEIIGKNIIPAEYVRRNRANWLLGRAENVADQRSIDSWFSTGNVWGVYAAKILYGTYLSTATNSEVALYSQQNLLNQSFTGNVASSSKTQILKLLRTHTYDSEKQININAPFAFFVPSTGNVKKRYYCRVNSRMVFCIKSIVEQANFLSEQICNNARHWDNFKDQWVNDLGHSMDIVDYCVEQKRNAFVNYSHRKN